jgi:GT2 family glycosyltransferase
MAHTESADMLTVVVVSYNSKNVIIDALRPFVHEPGISLLVVDNASQDSTVADIKQRIPSAEILELSENLGFAKAVNLAIEYSSSPNVLLLNPDAIITAGDVRTLLSALTPNTGIVAPLIKEPGDRLQIVSAGHFPTIWRMFLHFSAIARVSQDIPVLQGHYLFPSNLTVKPMTVDWVTGACMLFTKATWRLAGGLSEHWFMYAEDIDYCFRIRALGLAVELIPSVSASHLVGQSDSTGSFSANPAWILNLHEFYETELSPSRIHGMLWCLVVGIGLLSRSFLFRIKGIRAGRSSQWNIEASRFRVFAFAVIRRGTWAARRAR